MRGNWQRNAHIKGLLHTDFHKHNSKINRVVQFGLLRLRMAKSSNAISGNFIVISYGKCVAGFVRSRVHVCGAHTCACVRSTHVRGYSLICAFRCPCRLSRTSLYVRTWVGSDHTRIKPYHRWITSNVREFNVISTKYIWKVSFVRYYNNYSWLFIDTRK